jgi:hypothetical protein
VNTAIAIASDLVRMAQPSKTAIETGLQAHEIRLGEKQWTVSPTSPLTAFLSAETEPKWKTKLSATIPFALCSNTEIITAPIAADGSN